MNYRFRQVDSLEGINPDDYPGDIFVLPSGEMFQANSGDQLGGFWSKLLGIAAPFAAAIPGVGIFASMGLSAAAGALEQKEATKFQKHDQTIQQLIANFDGVQKALTEGQITTSEANAVINQLDTDWHNYRVGQSKLDDRDYLYHKIEVPIIAPKRTAIKAKMEEVAKVEAQKATATANAEAQQKEAVAFGLSFTELAIAGVVLFLFLRS